MRQFRFRDLRHVAPGRLLSFALAVVRAVQLGVFHGAPSTAVTVVLPLADKDVECLGISLPSLSNSGLNVKRICVVGSLNLKKAVDGIPNVEFIDEEPLLKNMSLPEQLILGGQNRTGWLCQQLLKLQLASEASTELVLWMDADTIFLRPVAYKYKKKSVLHVAREFHKPYQDNIDRLVPGLSHSHLSFVTHTMLVNKAHINELIAALGGHSVWTNTILRSLDKSEASGFSEFDLYARFVLAKHADNYLAAYRVHRDIDSIEQLREKFLVGVSTVSIHQRA